MVYAKTVEKKFQTKEIVSIKQVTTIREDVPEYVRSSMDLSHWLMSHFGDESQEHMFVFCLNTKNRVVSFSIVHTGTLNQSIAHPRDIFLRAVLSNAARILIAHNHPSGNPKPSENDLLFTQRCKEAGDILGIDVLDHIVFGTEKYISLREEGFWN